MKHRSLSTASHNRLCVIITGVCLVVGAGAAAAVAALPELIVIPDAVAVGAQGLTAGCLAVLYALGVSMQSSLFGPRPRVRTARPQSSGR